MKACIDQTGMLIITPETDAESGYIRNLSKLLNHYTSHEGCEGIIGQIAEEKLLKLNIIVPSERDTEETE